MQLFEIMVIFDFFISRLFHKVCSK